MSGLVLRNTETGELTERKVDGLFVSIGQAPETELFQGQLELDNSGYIAADGSIRTNISGVFAVGDIRTKVFRQVITAAADGAAAAHFAGKYLARQRWKTEIRCSLQGLANPA